jgi:outer membrane protein OmpU
MRKVLCGTTALVGTCLAAGAASAGQALKLGISGFYRGAAGLSIGGDSAIAATNPNLGLGDEFRTSGGFRQEIRLNFTGETVLNNGITVGVLVGINAENLVAVGRTDGTPTRTSYVDFRGKFGDFRFGEMYGALLTNCVLDPGNVTASFGVNSPWESFNNAARATLRSAGKLTNATVGVELLGSIGTCFGVDYLSTKLAYFTPAVGGFTFGISFAPSGYTRNPGGGYFYGTDLKTAKASDVISTSLSFNHDFGGGKTLTASIGADWAIQSYTAAGSSLADKPSTYAGGFQLGLGGGWTVGAGGAYVVNYKQAGYAATDALPSDDSWIATVGASYTTGSWSFGLEGLYSSWQVFGDTGHDNIWHVSLNGTYALGPGVNLEGQIAYAGYDANNLLPPSAIEPISYHGLELDTGFAIAF